MCFYSFYLKEGPFWDEKEEDKRKEWDGRENSQEVELSRVQSRGEEETGKSAKPVSPCKKVEELQSTKSKLELCVAKKKDQDSNSRGKIDEKYFRSKKRKDGDTDRNKANRNKTNKVRDTGKSRKKLDKHGKRKANKENIYLVKKKRNDELGKKKNTRLSNEVEPSQDDFTSSEVSHMNKTKVGNPVVFKPKNSSTPGSGPNTSLLPGSILGSSPPLKEVLIWKNYKIPKQVINYLIKLFFNIQGGQNVRIVWIFYFVTLKLYGMYRLYGNFFKLYGFLSWKYTGFLKFSLILANFSGSLVLWHSGSLVLWFSSSLFL